MLSDQQRAQILPDSSDGYRARPVLQGQLDAISQEERFAWFDFNHAAMRGSKTSWQTYAALGLVGKTEQALAGLKSFEFPEALFYQGVTLWISGDDDGALKLLKRSGTQYARALIDYIEKPLISILCQRPPDWSSAILPSHRFKLEEVELDADGNLIGFDSSNDFYFSFPIEWHRLPRNLRDLGCPTIGTVVDFDAHLQSVVPWLEMFDELIVGSSRQWEELLHVTMRPPVTYPKLYGINPAIPGCNRGPRQNDLFLSGFIVHPFNPDKTLNLLEALKIEDVALRCTFGFVGSYMADLAQTKASWTYVRWPDGISTRGLESLAMGCALVVQSESILRLYAGEDAGVLAYSRPSELSEKLKQIINNWTDFQERAQRGAQIVRREFARTECIEQFLRFATFLAARPRSTREAKKSFYLPHKDIMFFRGTSASPFERSTIITNELSEFLDELKISETPYSLLDTANRVALEHGRSAFPPAMRAGTTLTYDKSRFHVATGLYDMILGRFKNSLVTPFNKIRFMLHFGGPKDVTDALSQLTTILSTPTVAWQITPYEDVFPLDFFSYFFNYRHYLDRAMSQLMLHVHKPQDLASLIYASLHFYASHYADDIFHLRRAIELDGDMPTYKLGLARALINRGDDPGCQEAIGLLVPLAEESVVFESAYDTLAMLNKEGRFPIPGFESITKRMTRFRESLTDTENEDWDAISLQPANMVPQTLLELGKC